MAELWTAPKPWYLEHAEQTAAQRNAAMQSGAQQGIHEGFQAQINKKARENQDELDQLKIKMAYNQLEYQGKTLQDAEAFQDFTMQFQQDPDNTKMPKFQTFEMQQRAINLMHTYYQSEAAKKSLSIDTDFNRNVASFEDPSFTAELLEMKKAGAPMSQIIQKMREFSEIERKRKSVNQYHTIPAVEQLGLANEYRSLAAREARHHQEILIGKKDKDEEMVRQGHRGLLSVQRERQNLMQKYGPIDLSEDESGLIEPQSSGSLGGSLMGGAIINEVEKVFGQSGQVPAPSPIWEEYQQFLKTK